MSVNERYYMGEYDQGTMPASVKMQGEIRQIRKILSMPRNDFSRELMQQFEWWKYAIVNDILELPIWTSHYYPELFKGIDDMVQGRMDRPSSLNYCRVYRAIAVKECAASNSTDWERWESLTWDAIKHL